MSKEHNGSLMHEHAMNTTNKDVKPRLDWQTIIEDIRLTGLARSAALHAHMLSKENNVINLNVSHGHSSLFTPVVIKRLESALCAHFKEPIKIQLNLQSEVSSTPAKDMKVSEDKRLNLAEHALQEDPVFQKIQKTFNGELVKESVGSLDKDGL